MDRTGFEGKGMDLTDRLAAAAAFREDLATRAKQQNAADRLAAELYGINGLTLT